MEEDICIVSQYFCFVYLCFNNCHSRIICLFVLFLFNGTTYSSDLLFLGHVAHVTATQPLKCFCFPLLFLLQHNKKPMKLHNLHLIYLVEIGLDRPVECGPAQLQFWGLSQLKSQFQKPDAESKVCTLDLTHYSVLKKYNQKGIHIRKR